MDILSMAAAKKAMPKTIDLRNYTANYDGSSVVLNDIALMLFSGALNSELGFASMDYLTGCDAFWQDINTEQPLQLVLDGGNLGVPALLEMNGLSRVVHIGEFFSPNEPTQLTGRFSGLLNNAVLQIVVIFDRYVESGDEYSRVAIITKA